MSARPIICSLVAWICSLAPAAAQQPPGPAPTAVEQDQPAPAIDVRGNFDMGFRWTAVGGDRTNYREDVNLRTGARLFNLDLNLRPGDRRFFDLINITGDHLGGDPFETFAVTAQRFGTFTFEYRRDRSDYFYRDTLLPPEQASVSLSSGGDFHTFDFERTNDQFRFDLQPSRRIKTFFRFNHQSRRGDSETTLDLSRDEFELEQPLDQRKNDATVGVQVSFDRVSLYFDETVRDYESDGRTFLPGASAGENPANLTELFFFDQRMPFDFTMPQSTVRVNARPTDRLSITAGFVRADLDADLSITEAVRGVAFTGAPLVTTLAATGSLERATTTGEFDVAYAVNDRLSVIGGAWFGRFDQESTLVQDGSPVDTGLEISTNQGEIGAQFAPTGRVTLTGGVRFERREPTFREADGEHAAPETDRATVFLNASLTPIRTVNVSAEYERGDYDNPFTLISPTSLDRVKARVRYRPTAALSLTGSLLAQRMDNALSGGSFDTTAFTAAVSYDVGEGSVFASYSRHARTNEITNVVTFLPATQRALAIFYESDVDMGNGSFRYQLLPWLAPGADLTVYRNRGTFGLDWRRIRVFTDLIAPAGYFVRLGFQRHVLDEVGFDFDDYDANIGEVSVGYRF